MLHADFLLTANRQDLDRSNRWNQHLIAAFKSAIVEAFVDMAKSQSKRVNLRHTWIKYIPAPDYSDSVFAKLKNDVRNALRESAILESEASDFRPPFSLQFIPTKFKDETGMPLTMSSTSAPRYLSRKYSDDDAKALLNLGVTTMSFADFLKGLDVFIKRHSLDFRRKSKNYHCSIARVLLEYVSDETYSGDIHTLPIIRVRGGDWVSARDGNIFFPGEGTGRDIPEGVQALIVQSQYAKAPQLRNLYVALGVTQLSDIEICRLIIRSHRNITFQPNLLSLEDLVSHVLFLYETGFQDGTEASDLWLATEDLRYFKAYELYQNVPIPHSVRRHLRGIMDCAYIHPAYMAAVGHREQDLSKWLHQHLDIWRIPRLAHFVGDGAFEITPEFAMILEKRSSSEFLVLLRDCWPAYSQWFLTRSVGHEENIDPSVESLKQSISFTTVDCFDGVKAPLFQTFLPFFEWTYKAVQIPLLLIPDYHLPAWQFLQLFGVQVRRSVHFYLYCLGKVATGAQKDSETYHQVRLLYGELEEFRAKDAELVRWALFVFRS